MTYDDDDVGFYGGGDDEDDDDDDDNNDGDDDDDDGDATVPATCEKATGQYQQLPGTCCSSKP